MPTGLSDWTRPASSVCSPVLWVGVALTLVLIVGLRYTAVSRRRFQAVGANPVGLQVVGVRVNGAQYPRVRGGGDSTRSRASRWRGSSARRGSPSAPSTSWPDRGRGDRRSFPHRRSASPLSTFAAAFFLTGLNQMLRTMGLPTALQFVVFGLVIIGGMLVSGDRIVRASSKLIREAKTRIRTDAHAPRAPRRRDVPGGGEGRSGYAIP